MFAGDEKGTMRILDFTAIIDKAEIVPVPPVDTAERLRQAYKIAEINGKVLPSTSIG